MPLASIKVYSKKPGEKNSPAQVKKIHQIRQRKDFDVLYSRLPFSVLCDPVLTFADKAIYAAAAVFVWHGRVCVEPCAVVAEMCGASKRQAMKSLAALAKRGHIKFDDGKKERKVNPVELTSPVFGQKQGKADVIVSSPLGKRLVSVEEKIA